MQSSLKSRRRSGRCSNIERKKNRRRKKEREERRKAGTIRAGNALQKKPEPIVARSRSSGNRYDNYYRY